MNLDVIFKNFSKIQLGQFNLTAKNLVPEIKNKILDIQSIKLLIKKLNISDIAFLKDLEVLIPSLTCNINDIPSVINSLKDNPPELSSMVLHIYINAINRLANNKELLNIKEIQNIKIEIKGGKLHVTGNAKKVITVPFLTIVSLRTSQDGKKVIITIEKVQVLGFLPVPGFGLSWALDIVSEKLNFDFVEKIGQSFVIDTEKALPVPIKMKLNMKLEGNSIIVMAS